MADYAKGQLLRELRASTGKSREQVAHELGVTTKTVYAWENSGGIKMGNAIKIADLFGVEDPATLISRESAGVSQLDRIEAKLDAILGRLGVAQSLGDLADEALDADEAPAGSQRRAG
ncbi:MAG: helix-turn-helix transcriptional regulator [Patulibacter sp.]